MKKNMFKCSAVALAVSAAMIAPAAADTSITGSVRIGGLFDDGGGVDDFSITNLGSRFIMSVNEDIGGGLKGIGRIEVGINPEFTGGGGARDGDGRGGGFDRTRQIWGGIAGGFGSVKVGAQYSAFYDTVTSKGDIAWWGSCFLEFDCSRESNVLKYSGGSGGFTFNASIEAVPDGSASGGTDEEIEEFEIGVGFKAGPVKLGAAFATEMDGGNDGTLFGLAASGNFSGVGLSLVLQFADDDFADENIANPDDQTVVTVTGTFANFYGLFTSRDQTNNTPTSFTLGYQWNIAKKTLMYFEFQQLDADDGSDENSIVRAILKRDFTIASTGG